jgi:hypothetical protein
MKKFTFLLSLLLIAAMAHSQSNQPTEAKIRKAHEKFTRITGQTSHFLRLAKSSVNNHFSDQLSLKSLTETVKLDSTIYMYMEEGSGVWLNDLKDEYHYNAQMQNTQWLEKDWDASGNTWMDYGRVELEYNSEGRVSAMESYYYDDDTQGLVLESRIVAFYDAEGKPDSILHYSPESENVWVLEAKQTYHYNAAGQVIRMDFISEEEDEVSTISFVYTYNNAGLMENSSMYFIDEDMEFLYSETKYTYDSNGRRITSEFSSLNFFTFMVELSSHTDYEYNAAGDVSVETTSSWEEEKWEIDYKDEYTYGTTDFSEVIFPTYFHMFGVNDVTVTFNKVPTEIITSEWVDGSWLPTEKIVFYFSSGTATNVQQLQTFEISMFPNPASEHVSFRWNGSYEQLSLEIYQITGAKMLEKNISSGIEVPISQLNNGMYFYRLMNRQQTVHTGKLIKK